MNCELFKRCFAMLPMQKVYSLLRNNKQTGPYTLEELVGLSLKPFDLIWVEGESGGWSYPTEIDALKPYVTEPAKPLKKQREEEITPASIPLTNNLTGSPNAAPSKHIYISFPAGKEVGKTTAPTSFPTIASEEESPEAKLERKAQELRNKIQAFAEGKKAPLADNDLDVKYTRSLDDIKEEYSDWLHQQKKKKNIPFKKTTAIVLAASLLAFAAYFLAARMATPNENAEKELAVQNVQAKQASLIENTVDKPEKRDVISKKNNKPKKEVRKPISKKSATTNSLDEVDAYIDSLHKAEIKSRNETAQTPSASNEKNEEETQTIAKRSSQKETTTPFVQLVQLSESTGSEGTKLTIYNNSDRYINFVAVDVFYYKANDKLLQKKTLYFNDISPKTASPLYVPELKRAASVKYQLGLISTNNGLYYAKQ